MIKKAKAGVLPTKSTSSKRAAELTKRMLVTTKALTHLEAKGLVSKMARTGCCKPDGGPCCVNKKP